LKLGNQKKKKMKSLEKGGLIGLHIEVVNSKNKDNIGIKGKIIDETKNMLIIKTKDKIKKMIKNQIYFSIKERNVKIDGREFVGTCEERIKKK